MRASGTTHFIHDLDGNVIAETDGTGATGTVREYIWLPEAEIAPTMGSRAQVDRPLAVVDGVNSTPVLYFVHVDHLHRPVRMTNAAKNTVWEAVWWPFGAALTLSGPASLDLRFPGQWFQLESGLHYNWHRHYDRGTGRYTQPDPLGFVDGPGVYGYAGGSALLYVDPDGRQRLGPPMPRMPYPRPYAPPRPDVKPKPDSGPTPYPGPGWDPLPPVPGQPRAGKRFCELIDETDSECLYDCGMDKKGNFITAKTQKQLPEDVCKQEEEFDFPDEIASTGVSLVWPRSDRCKVRR